MDPEEREAWEALIGRMRATQRHFEQRREFWRGHHELEPYLHGAVKHYQSMVAELEMWLREQQH